MPLLNLADVLGAAGDGQGHGVRGVDGARFDGGEIVLRVRGVGHRDGHLDGAAGDAAGDRAARLGDVGVEIRALDRGAALLEFVQAGLGPAPEAGEVEGGGGPVVRGGFGGRRNRVRCVRGGGGFEKKGRVGAGALKSRKNVSCAGCFMGRKVGKFGMTAFRF